MTREEAWKKAKGYLYDTLSGEEADEIIKALEQELCEDAISRQAVFNKTINVPIAQIVTEDEVICRRVVFVDDIENLPPVTPQQKYGKWIKHPEIETSTPEYLMFYECSECGDKQCFYKSDLHKKRFCNSCGAKMESEVRNEV